MINTLHVTTEEYEKRRSICMACEFYNKQTKSCGTLLPLNLIKGKGGDLVELEGRERKVRLCGCYMPAKWKLSFSECSLPGEHSKWGKTVSKAQYKEVKDLLNNQVSSSEWNEKMLEIYNSTFTRTEKDSSLTCGKCLQRMKKQLEELVKNYNG